MASVINKFMFREYDIRGLAGTELTTSAAELIGKAFGTYLQAQHKKRVAVGRDHRLSSPELHSAFICGLTSTGCDVVDYGLIPTPAVHWAVVQHKLDAGACVTASHNPPEYNGFKLYNGALSIGGNQIQDLLKLCEEGKFAIGNGGVSKRELLEEYANYLALKCKLPVMNKRLKVVVDAGNGMTGMSAPLILRKMGLEVVELYCELDGTFPNHVADPSVDDSLRELIARVKKEKADFGLAFDGDGDRIAVIDEKGNILHGDQLVALFARSLLAKQSGEKCIFDITCSMAVEEDIKKHGGVPIRWKTGHTNIELKLEEEKAILGGETSGHMFFRDFHYIDDAVYAGCKFAQMLAAKSNVPASAMLVGYPLYFNSPKVYIKSTDEKKWKIVVNVRDELVATGNKVSELDGVMAIFTHGWGLVRASNTSPSIVVRFEAKSEKELEEIRNIFAAALAKQGIKI